MATLLLSPPSLDYSETYFRRHFNFLWIEPFLKCLISAIFRMSLTCIGLILSAFHSAGHPFFPLFLFSFGAGTWTGLRDMPTPRISPLRRQVLGQLYNFTCSVILESDIKPVFRGSYWTIWQLLEVPLSRKQAWTFHTRSRFLTDAREPRADRQNVRDVSPVWKRRGLHGK